MIFVTGGTGLLGAHLLFDLISNNKKVRALKRSSSNLNQVKKVFQFYHSDSTLFDKIEWVDGDTLDILSIEKALNGVSFVYHCAAVVSFEPEMKDLMWKINVEGTSNMVNACLNAGVNKFCHVSSTAAIGKSKKNEIIDETNNEWDETNTSFYSKTKHFSELEVWRGHTEGLNTVIVNPSIILGPGNWGQSSTSVFLEVWKGLNFYTNGSNAFVDVRDVSKCMILLMNSNIAGERFLIVSENLPFRALFNKIADAFHKPHPKFKVGSLLSSVAWMANFTAKKIIGTRTIITKETAQSAQSNVAYSNEKIKKALKVEFIPINLSIKETAEKFLKSELNIELS